MVEHTLGKGEVTSSILVKGSVVQMVQEGMIVVYPQYLNGCASTKDQYLQAERSAKQQGLGVWSPNNSLTIMP